MMMMMMIVMLVWIVSMLMCLCVCVCLLLSVNKQGKLLDEEATVPEKSPYIKAWMKRKNNEKPELLFCFCLIWLVGCLFVIDTYINRKKKIYWYDPRIQVIVRKFLFLWFFFIILSLFFLEKWRIATNQRHRQSIYHHLIAVNIHFGIKFVKHSQIIKKHHFIYMKKNWTTTFCEWKLLSFCQCFLVSFVVVVDSTKRKKSKQQKATKSKK